MATLKLQTNIPVFGIVKYMDYYPGKTVDGQEYAAQVGLKGNWESHGEATIYLPQALVNDIIGAGLARSDGEKVFQGQTVPRFHWSYQGRVQILKAEEGRTKRTTVLAVDAPPLHPAAAPAPQPVHRPQATVRDASPGYGQPMKQADAIPVDQWAVLERTYARAHTIAVKTWGEEYPPEALVAAAATVFIEANKRGLSVVPQPDYNKMPPALERDDPGPWA